MNTLKYILIVITFLIMNGCDLDKFTGYDHEADPIPESARIYGILINKFTQLPINDAIIQVGDQATFSDENGKYEFFYHLGDDEDRNKEVKMLIYAKNFLPIDTNVVIFPENEIDKGLAYASPIIKRIARINNVCQAEIFDYQGWEDIAHVWGEFYYVRGDERVIALTIRLPLQRVDTDTPNIAYYQCKVYTSIDAFGELIRSFKIFTTDRLGYADSTNHVVSGVDSLLFPPVSE